MAEQSQKRSLAPALLWGMIAVLIVVGLLSPPISLVKRLFHTDFARLDADGARVAHPDGIELSVDPALLDDPIYVQLGSVPRLLFTGDAIPEEWQPAARALPAHLVLKSPVFSIDFRGDANPPVLLDISIPNDAEPNYLLDLYAWDGDQWQWVPSQLDLATDKITVALDQAPQAIGVVQAGAPTPTVGLLLEQDESLHPEIGGLVTEIYPAGLFLGPGGLVIGQAAALEGDGSHYQQFPTILAADAVMVQALLSDPAAQQSHLNALASLLANSSYAGLNVDFQGVSEAQRDAFTAFVAELATQLHAVGLDLLVTVPAPTPTASGDWETAGYDWPALLDVARADRLLITLPLDPLAFMKNGLVDSLLTWAVTQVNRYQLLVGINAAGVQEINGEFSPADLAESLNPLNTLLSRVDQGGNELSPGGEVVVELPAGTLLNDLAVGTYRITYQADGQRVVVWLPSAVALDRKFEALSRFHLGGVLLRGVLGSEMEGEFAVALNAFLTAAAPPVVQPASLTWAVQDASGGALDQVLGDLGNPRFAWQAGDTPGTYTINGQFGIGTHVADLGAVQVAVVVEPTATPEPEPTLIPEPTATPAVVASSGATSEAPSPDADAVISGPVVNVREGPGTSFRQISYLVAGTPLEVHAVTPNSTWIRISAPDGTQGWVYAPLCTIRVNLADLPVEDIPTPTAPVAPPSAAPPVSGGGFELGGHIRSWNYLSQMGSAGMNWVKVQVHYGQDASGLVSMAHSNGFKIQLSALGSRDMVSQANFHSDYSAWVAGMAAAGADAIEVWNEPNIEVEWPLGQINPTAYTQLLCSAYGAIKNANGGTMVISAAPAPTGYFGGCSGNGCDDLPWLQGLVNAGAANCMDYIGAHHNAGATSPSASSGHPADGGGGHHSWYFLPQTQLYYNVFGGSRKLFYTEMGYASQEGVSTFSDWFSWARGINNAQQAAWLAEAASLSSSTGMVRCLIVWNLDFSRYGDDPQDGYAIIRPDGSCPACATLGAVMGQ